MVSYQTYAPDTDFLYASTMVEKPYYVDPLLYSYLARETFDATLNVAMFLRDNTLSHMSSESASDVRRCLSSMDPSTITGKCGVATSSVFTGNPFTEDLTFSVSYGASLSPSKLTSIVTNLVLLTLPPVLTDSKTNTAGLTTFMQDVINTVCSSFLTDAIRAIPSIASPGKAAQGIANALSEVSAIPASLMQVLVTNLHAAAAKTLQSISLRRIGKVAITNAEVQYFCTHFDNEFYYELRTGMVAEFSLVNLFGQEANASALVYIKKVLVDLYIKSCYPYVMFNHITALTDMYTAKGDFVNVRVGLLSKVFFTFFMLSNVYTMYQKVAPADTNSLTKLTSIFSLLNSYIYQNNNISLDADGGQVTTTASISKILADLHTMSRETSSMGDALQQKKEDIEGYQLSLRNMILNMGMIQRRAGYPRFAFWALFATLMCVIVLCVTLLILDKPRAVMAVSGSLFSCVLLFVVGSFVWGLLFVTVQ